MRISRPGRICNTEGSVAIGSAHPVWLSTTTEATPGTNRSVVRAWPYSHVNDRTSHDTSSHSLPHHSASVASHREMSQRPGLTGMRSSPTLISAIGRARSVKKNRESVIPESPSRRASLRMYVSTGTRTTPMRAAISLAVG